MRVVRRRDWTAMPWRNGGGVTHEVLREGGEGFTLRLSVAEVAADGPFSRFPGVDRTICLFQGGGFRLWRADGLDVTVRQRGVPFSFLGEDAWDCTLLDGPVLDFNVMVRRDRLRAAVTALPLGPGPVVLPAGPRRFLFVLDGAVTVDAPGGPLRLEGGDLVETSGVRADAGQGATGLLITLSEV